MAALLQHRFEFIQHPICPWRAPRPTLRCAMKPLRHHAIVLDAAVQGRPNQPQDSGIAYASSQAVNVDLAIDAICTACSSPDPVFPVSRRGLFASSLTRSRAASPCAAPALCFIRCDQLTEGLAPARARPCRVPGTPKKDATSAHWWRSLLHPPWLPPESKAAAGP